MATRVMPFSPVLPDFPSHPAPPPGEDAIIISDPHVPLHASLAGSPSAVSQIPGTDPGLVPAPPPLPGRSDRRSPNWDAEVPADSPPPLRNATDSRASGDLLFRIPGAAHAPPNSCGSYTPESGSSQRASVETKAILAACKLDNNGNPIGDQPLLDVDSPKGVRPSVNSKRQANRSATQKKLVKDMRNGTQEPIWKSFSRKIVENKFFVGMTTVLTVYALIGDDFRLLATNKPADDLFNVFTLTCLAVFLFEIIVSCLGKSDYFMGFFFILDVISTATLLLDLTWVAESLLDGGEGVDKLRSGRTARVGAKAGRVVRVIRLVRIIKLWKAIQDAKAEKRRREKESEGGEDDWGEDDNGAKLHENNVRESRVGRKLSEMTTRRVIILILTMLLTLPLLQTDSGSQPPQSPWFAADDVYEAFVEWNRTRQPTDQLRYERSMLRYLYYFNWFSGTVDEWVPPTSMSPRDFQSHVFWVGIMSSNEDSLKRPFWVNATQLRSSTVLAWEKEVTGVKSNDIYTFGGMPPTVTDIMSTPWRVPENCDSKSNVFRLGFSILHSELDGLISYAVPCPEALRFTEKTKYYPRLTSEAEYNDWHFAFYFDLRPFTRQEAIFGLCVTGFICLVLVVASLYFSHDANRLVLRPVENMVKRVEMIRNDPLIAVKMADEEFKVEEKLKAAQARQKGMKGGLSQLKQALNCFVGTTQEPMETVILEKTIIKLGSLLALGFGEAGANIIGHNLQSSDSAGVNAMIQGMRVEAIIGLARIRDFSTATEVLKAKVMTFVNQIAEIVHGVVSEFHGAANKNNGDTFLLIWRISGLEPPLISRMADMSTIAFAKILGALHRSRTLADYRGHPALQQRLGRNCRVCVTMGLHAGWAIEGAVGSEFKIDASYLSPNVSIAVQVEQATNIYNVPILITEQVTQLCSTEIAGKFRKIDRVVIRGSATPTYLLCLDLDYMCLDVDTDTSCRPTNWNSRWRFKARQFLDAEKTRKLDPEIKTVTMFDQCKDIALMQSKVSIEFLQLFNFGFQNYMEAEWEVASRVLTETKGMLGAEDGPSSALLRFMEHLNFTPPDNWHGIHELHL